jgi:two-component system, chemotaxis family, sensor kinase CheA
MSLTNKRIFLVEDNIGSLTITKTLLELHGAVVGTHSSGHDVVPHLLNFLPVDLIILDLMLPSGVTGYNIFQAIRDQDELQEAPVIAMSVADRSKVIPEAQKRGFSGFISKPLDFREFPKLIDRIIEGESIW